jgi:hypothetical protein
MMVLLQNSNGNCWGLQIQGGKTERCRARTCDLSHVKGALYQTELTALARCMRRDYSRAAITLSIIPYSNACCAVI